MERCRHCQHGRHEGDCQIDRCGCVRFEPVDRAAREARQRLWIVKVAFRTRRGWSPEREVRVRAGGLTGATMRGVQTARRDALPRGTRVMEARVLAMPVPGTALRTTPARNIRPGRRSAAIG